MSYKTRRERLIKCKLSSQNKIISKKWVKNLSISTALTYMCSYIEITKLDVRNYKFVLELLTCHIIDHIFPHLKEKLIICILNSLTYLSLFLCVVANSKKSKRRKGAKWKESYTIIKKTLPVPYRTTSLQNFSNFLEKLKDASIWYAGSMSLQTYLIDANTHRIWCRSRSDTYSAWRCQRLTFWLFASFNLFDRYFLMKVLMLFSKCRGCYL